MTIRVTLASRGNSAFVEFQGQEVLFLQDALRCSTRESISWHHRKKHTLFVTSFRFTYKNQNFSWFTSDVFLWRTVSSYQDSYVPFLRGGLQAKVVPERTTYCAWRVPQRVPLSVSSRVLRSDVASWAHTSGTPKIKLTTSKDAEWSSPTHVHHSHCTSRQLRTKANQRYDIPWDWLWEACPLARVRWGTCCNGFCSKEGLHYHIEQSARNQLERDQEQRALGKLSRSCQKTSNNQPWFTSLEIPWGFLAQAVLRWPSRGLCHTRKFQLKDIVWEEQVCIAIAQQTFAWETFDKRRKWERKPVVSLLPGSREHLALRKPCVLCQKYGGACMK